jgi:diaminohydroxyphosphoribosylaminopyrimidine deaminase/5-amino-6-(5-phosphoribosylamino)uracil reductase
VDRIIQAGIRRVIIAARDPNPLVNGRGVERLRAAGIEVVEEVLAGEARALNEVFFHWIQKRAPFVVLKLALSLDGKIASSTGVSRWITDPAARKRVHELRRCYAAVLVGIQTVLTDDPQLTVREDSGPQPLRVVLDSRGRIPLSAKALNGEVLTLVATTEAMPKKIEQKLREKGAEVWRLPAQEGRVDLGALLARLGDRGNDSVLVEGGGEVAWSFLSQNLVHKVAFFYAPLILGGRRAVPAVGGEGFAEPALGLRIRKISWEPVGEDLLITGYPSMGGEESENST